MAAHRRIAERNVGLDARADVLPRLAVAPGYDDGITATANAKTTAPTGVEMEALTAVSVALLTIYDMCKAVDKSMHLEGIYLVSKSKS